MGVGSSLHDAYERGSGHVVLRAKAEVENGAAGSGGGRGAKGGKRKGAGATSIVITEIPYQTSKVSGGKVMIQGDTCIAEGGCALWGAVWSCSGERTL